MKAVYAVLALSFVLSGGLASAEKIATSRPENHIVEVAPTEANSASGPYDGEPKFNTFEGVPYDFDCGTSVDINEPGHGTSYNTERLLPATKRKQERSRLGFYYSAELEDTSEDKVPPGTRPTVKLVIRKGDHESVGRMWAEPGARGYVEHTVKVGKSKEVIATMGCEFRK